MVTKRKIKGKTSLQIRHGEANFEIKIPFQDEASVENAITCLMVLLHFNYDPKIIQDRMQGLYQIEMRLMVKKGINNTKFGKMAIMQS